MGDGNSRRSNANTGEVQILSMNVSKDLNYSWSSSKTSWNACVEFVERLFDARKTRNESSVGVEYTQE